MADSKDGPLGYRRLTSLLPWAHCDKIAIALVLTLQTSSKAKLYPSLYLTFQSVLILSLVFKWTFTGKQPKDLRTV